MFKKQFSLVVVVLLLLGSSVVFAAQKKETKFGIGYQTSFPAWGISGMMDVNDNVSVQGVLGLFGDVTAYAGRGIYRFKKEPNWNTYGYGMIGAWSYQWSKWDWSKGKWVEKTETTIGIGAGVGIEYNWQIWWGETLPPVWWNLEIGFGSAKFKEADYDLSTFMLGTGAHYRF